MGLFVGLDDAFAALASATGPTIAPRLEGFAAALRALDDGDAGAARDLVAAAEGMLAALMDAAHTRAAREAYDTALEALVATQSNVDTATPPFTLSGGRMRICSMSFLSGPEVATRRRRLTMPMPGGWC